MVEITNKDNIKDITFSCDGFDLKASLHLPPVERPPVVIGCHGLLSDRNSPKQIALAEQCNQLNLAFLRIDHRGCGESQGEFETVTSLDARCRDLMCAIELMKSRTDVGDPIGLFGSSMGGAVCLQVAGSIGIGPLVTVAAPIRSRQIEQTVDSPVKTNDREYRSDAEKNSFDISQKLSKICNILIFHGEHDAVVPLSHAHEILQQVGDPKKLIIQKGGDHRMSNPEHQQDFIREASLWLQAGLSPKE
jgi:alpha-beta hydrolase superfamily lysophospholipase